MAFADRKTQRCRLDILDRPMRLRLIGTLVLVAAGLTGMVYALTQGNLWAAGLLAFNGAVLFVAYRRRSSRSDGCRVSPTGAKARPCGVEDRNTLAAARRGLNDARER